MVDCGEGVEGSAAIHSSVIVANFRDDQGTGHCDCTILERGERE